MKCCLIGYGWLLLLAGAAEAGGGCCGVSCQSNNDCAPNLFCCPNHNECMGDDTKSTAGPDCDACQPSLAAPASKAKHCDAADASSAAPSPGYEVRHFDQSLDHFDPENKARWSHRYLYNASHWDGRGKLPNGCRGPILLYTGNEGDITGFFGANGFMTEVLAPKLGAMTLFPEERYYGESMPFGDQKTSFEPRNLRYLTTEQVLADYVELLDHVKSTTPGAANCPVVAFGGSYGGTLTTFLRLKYPAAVVGGLAASAPIGYYDPEGWAEHGVSAYTWSEIAARVYDEADPQCTAAIRAATRAIDAAAAASVQDVVKEFNVCEKEGLGPNKPSELFAYALESIPQQNYPYAIGNHPAWPVNATCAVLVDALAREGSGNGNGNGSPLIKAAAKITGLYVGGEAGGDCLETLTEGPGGVPGDGPGPGDWGFQSCTQTLHMFSSKSALREYSFSLPAINKQCAEIFNGTVTPDPHALTRTFGGYGIPSSGVTNLIWSNGALDPWSGGGFLTPGDPSSGNHWIYLLKGAHHLDLRGPHPEDPAEITAARALEERIITGWIQDAGRA